jgi:crotonobetainyl-CoA:carnitine CoA-transferase CaiB-like acyl-CoA transferase
MTSKQKPLTGLKVLDMTQGVAGPYGTMLLALNGADVIKVEPIEGDWCRVLGRAVGQESVNYLAVNRGKRSLSLDAKSAGGREVLLKMATECDVFVESFRPGAIARLGLAYEDVRKLNPNIVYASVSGFGQTGPSTGRPTVDGLIQAYSGMMAMNKTPDGQPYRMPMIVIDVVTALYVYQAISTALVGKVRFGDGAHLDISLMQSAAAFQAAKIMEFVESAGRPVPPLYAPAGCFKTKDGYIVVTGMRANHFAALCRVVGREDMIHDPRWPTQNDRTAHADIINGELRKEFPRRPTSEWLAELLDAGVLAEAVRDYGQWLAEEHVIATRAFEWVESQAFGRIPVVAVPGVLPAGDDVTGGMPPLKGEQSRAVLHDFGFTDSWIAEQIAAGNVAETARTGS